MEVEPGRDGSLVLSYDSTRLSRVMFVLSAAMFAGVAYHLLSDNGDSERLFGFVGGTVTCALVAIFCVEQARMIVDPATRTIVWMRRGVFRTRSGTLSFEDITAVCAERPPGDSGIPSRRVVIFTRRGETVPLTAGYRSDGDRVILGASEHIRAMLEQHACAGRVQTLANAGGVIDTSTLVCQTERLPLAESKLRVDELRGLK